MWCLQPLTQPVFATAAGGLVHVSVCTSCASYTHSLALKESWCKTCLHNFIAVLPPPVKHSRPL